MCIKCRCAFRACSIVSHFRYVSNKRRITFESSYTVHDVTGSKANVEYYITTKVNAQRKWETVKLNKLWYVPDLRPITSTVISVIIKPIKINSQVRFLTEISLSDAGIWKLHERMIQAFRNVSQHTFVEIKIMHSSVVPTSYIRNSYNLKLQYYYYMKFKFCQRAYHTLRESYTLQIHFAQALSTTRKALHMHNPWRIVFEEGEGI